MATNINLKIKINENVGQTLSFTADKSINNVSSLLTSKTTKNDGVNGISMSTGYISLANGFLGNGGQLQSEINKYNGFMFGAVDSDGNMFHIADDGTKVIDTLELTLTGDNLDKIIIYFDQKAQQFASEAIIDGTKTIYNDDYVWVINLGTEKSSHTLKFVKWKRPNYNACFILIQILAEYLDLDKSWIEEVSSLAQSASDPSSIYYGVIANSGSATILDKKETLSDMIQDDVINPSSIPIQIILNGKLVQAHISNDSNFDTETNQLSVSLTNNVVRLGKLKYKGFAYPDGERNLYQILYDVLSNYFTTVEKQFTENDFKAMLSSTMIYGYNDDFIGTVETYLKGIIVPYPYIEANQTYEVVINDICTVAQLEAFLDNSGNLKFISARPVFSKSIDPIYLSSTALASVVSKDLVLKNKYDGVQITETLVKNEVDYNKLILSKDVAISESEFNSLPTETKDASDYVLESLGSTSQLSLMVAMYVNVKYYYYSGYFDIQKEQNYNLNKILDVYNWDNITNNNEYPYSIEFFEKEADATGSIHWDRSETKISLNGEPSISSFSGLKLITESGLVIDTYSYSGSGKQIKTSTTPNKPEFSVSEYDTYYRINFKICVGKEFIILGGSTTGDLRYDTNFDASGKVYKYTPKTLKISIYGNERIISFENITTSTDNINSAITVETISPSGKLLQTETKFGSNKISEIIKKNILSDYKGGLTTAKVTLNGVNMSNLKGKVVKNYENGDLADVGDIVNIFNQRNQDGKLTDWKVTGRNFKFDGEPLTEIEVIKCLKKNL